LSLVWASRAGIEEAEIITATGATPLAWAKLRNGLGDSLRNHEGRTTFSHDFLRSAVAARYLPTEEEQRAAHLALADRFAAREADARQAEELPYQLRAAGAWDRLEAMLVDLDRFELLRVRGNGELLGYWLPLQERGRNVEGLLWKAFEARTGQTEEWTPADIAFAFALAAFFRFAGAVGETAQRLSERRTLSLASEYSVPSIPKRFGA
jgi:hypothetical protein